MIRLQNHLYPNSDFYQIIRYHSGFVEEVSLWEYKPSWRNSMNTLDDGSRLIFRYVSENGKDFKDPLESCEDNYDPSLFD